jgi:hypothetical protein
LLKCILYVAIETSCLLDCIVQTVASKIGIAASLAVAPFRLLIAGVGLSDGCVSRQIYRRES